MRDRHHKVNFYEFLTPYKLNRPILEPTGKEKDFDKDMVDCPFVFFHNNKFYMAYIGFDGDGYRSGLCSSSDLINWKREGMILDWGEKGGFDCYGAAALSILHETDLEKLPVPKKWKGKYWATYTGYPEKGYENGPGAIGLVYSDDLFHWKRVDFNPIIKPDEGEEWERGGIYRTYFFQYKEQFYIFYNAKPKKENDWIEEIGFAISKDLKNWIRNSTNPIIKRDKEKSWDLIFGDPYIKWYKNKWVMFYCAVDKKNAREAVAFSSDLKNWQKCCEPLLDIGKEGEIDSLHAHKPCVIMYNKVLYHFYCAVRKEDQYRTITLATSRPLKF
ncbi:MAG: hypothetical protein NC899_08925 [Candidatus Omnitrophica bacterium]|nr:hypothetical protein [Candidatus Omnitrophota bacterium]